MSVERYFQRTAEKFDSLYDEGDRLKYLINWYLRRGIFDRVSFTLEELQKYPGCSVLDVGSGSGRNSAMFVQKGAGRVLGIDFSDRMIELAERYCRDKGVQSQCEFVKGDFLTFPFASRSDFVVALGFFDYIADPATFLAKMVGLANKGVVASFPGVSLLRAPLRKLRYALRGCPVYFYTHAQLKKICDKAGFSDYRIVRASSSGYMLLGHVSHPA